MDRQPFDDIRALIGELKPADEAARASALARLARVAPAGSLGALEPIVGWIAAWRGAAVLHRPIIALYAGAHAGQGGVAATREIMEAIAAGAAPVSRAAQHLGAGLDVFDLAIDRPVGDGRSGSKMSERECAATMAFGMEALAKQPDLVILGGFGQGVEASAAALMAALASGADDPLQTLRMVGGRETAAICGAILAAASQRVPVLLDGSAAIAAAAVVHAMALEAIAHCRVGQIGPDSTARRTLEQLGLSPLFDFGVTLRDGTGSTAALSLIKLACALSVD
jgi:nicotinate-nucleotide--dimethylbenzimidazole phosphoribosyltransferase